MKSPTCRLESLHYNGLPAMHQSMTTIPADRTEGTLAGVLASLGSPAMPERAPAPGWLRLSTAKSEDDAVTASRREFKCRLRRDNFPQVERVLTTQTEPIQFGPTPDSHVHSIYFDDDRMSGCEESLQGASRRAKLRLRWYDEPLATKRAWFEVKRRTGVMVGKDRFALLLDRPLATLTYRELIPAMLRVLPPEPAALLGLRCRPTVLVSYRRRHFREPISGLRLTIDSHVRGVEQSPAGKPSTRFPVTADDELVVEAKALPGEEQVVKRLLAPLPLRLTRSSKYVSLCGRMGWCSLSDLIE